MTNNTDTQTTTRTISAADEAYYAAAEQNLIAAGQVSESTAHAMMRNLRNTPVANTFYMRVLAAAVHTVTVEGLSIHPKALTSWVLDAFHLAR